MAYTTHHTAPAASASAVSVLKILAKPFVVIGNGLIAMGEANDRSRKVRTLMALSDAELAERGLKRDEIVQHVFSDVYYI
ncbi:hypothetical protein PXK00_08550 [Phaeobacter sp. QD34_3]|uniref:hypothetical protein n=1 Tax=unclassified Phaeobacter TaxID=2621772 RepID=UPI00237FA324|nr:MULTISPECIES: hypothetical protein [unclassified Phaeobacter]MDE4133159.1 hypothetical protein [Phaeobacter sp. QD34_3]MDE4136771.1 hypothetical protein [Phaeobacter sp. QD34_24]